MDEFMKQLLAGQARIAEALEKIAANGGGGFVAAQQAAKAADKPAAKAEEKPAPGPEKPAEPEGPTYTVDEVRTALKEFRAIEGAPAMMDVLKTHGKSDSIATVDAANYAAIMEAVGAAK